MILFKDIKQQYGGTYEKTTGNDGKFHQKI